MSANMNNVHIGFAIAEMWSDFLDWHEDQPTHLGGPVATMEDEVHEPSMMEFMDWLIDQLELAEPHIAEHDIPGN